MRTRTLLLLLPVFLFFPLLVACGSGETGGKGADSDSGADRPLAVATTGMIGDIVQGVAGDTLRVEVLMGPGTDPHLYSPRRSDLDKLLRADIIFYNGLHLEGRMGDALAETGKGKTVVALGELVLGGHDDHHSTGTDPHVWMDVSLWSRGVDAVQDVLSTEFPAHAETYAKNAAGLKGRLAALHAYGQEALATVPQERRVLITAHDAFHYFGEAYGIEVRGIQGLSTTSEAGLQDINALVDFIVERRIPAIFVESTISDKNVRALVEGAASRGHQVRIGGELFADAMGPGGTYEGTYEGMMEHNITVITRALGGEAPEKGPSGRLSSMAGTSSR